MHLSRYSALLAVACLLGACAETSVPFEPQLISVPAAVPASGPRLSGGSGDPLILSWMEEDDLGASLLYSRLERGAWSAPSTIASGIDMFVNWADMPSVQPMGNGRLSAHWLEKSADLTYAYDVVFVQSADGGASWSEPIRPHDDGTPTEHGFVSMFADDNATGLVWLDGRKMVNEVTDDPVATGMTLRGASIAADSTVTNEQLIDELICDCCQTDIAISDSGAIAVYRDRSVAEIRDISVTRRIEGEWQPGRTIADDAWEIPGCPVNGPSIVADGSFVAVAWFTAAGGNPIVKLALSQDNGQTFSAPLEVAAGKVLGRAGLSYLGDGDVAVSWLQPTDEGTNQVRVRRYAADGTPGPVRLVADNAGSFSVPQIGTSGDDLVFVWTETADFVNSVHSARVPAAAL